MNRIINMLIRQAIRSFMRVGVEKGADALASRTHGDETPEQRQKAREAAKRMKQGARITRRLGRF